MFLPDGRHVGLLEEDVLSSTLSIPAKLLFAIKSYYKGTDPRYLTLRFFAAKMGCSRQSVHYYQQELMNWERTGEVKRGRVIEREARELIQSVDESEPFPQRNTLEDSDKESDKIKNLNPLSPPTTSGIFIMRSSRGTAP